MKKLLLTLIAIIFLAPAALAGDCFQDPIYERDWNGEVTTGMFVRDVACMEGSVVLTTVPVGEVVKVIAETDGWYKVQTKDGIIGWSGQWLLQQTDKPFEGNEPKEPLYDVVGHKYEAAVRYLAENEIISGYPDGSYKPDNSVNRAEFTKIIVGAKLGSEPAQPSSNCFPDVDRNEWYATWVCYAKDQGIIGGYPDGTFKPANNINLAEATKILVNTLEVEMEYGPDSSGEWYEAFVRAMQNNNYIPDTFSSVSQLVNRSQMAEMVYRIMEEITDKPAKTLVSASPSEDPSESELAEKECYDDKVPASIDMNQVRAEWLLWHNQARKDRGVGTLSQNEGLNYSSALWASSNESIKTLTHDRPGGQSMDDWFDNIGIVFADKNGVVYGENLGLRTFRCSEYNCTDEALASARFIFDQFMAEEGTNFTGHYDNIVQPDFTDLGLGMAIDSSGEVMYLTAQYSFGLARYPGNLCQ
ncbi:S-layer homology domain-containing protein [Candidatus Peregrinibacteria bacterium]|nr:S-layer homology domain-containing protein [Candidatus Peregrinibacteria bacterium]